MRRFLLTILLTLPFALMAQDPAFVRINRQVQLFPQEKTHIHTDAADYYPAGRRQPSIGIPPPSSIRSLSPSRGASPATT